MHVPVNEAQTHTCATPFASVVTVAFMRSGSTVVPVGCAAQKAMGQPWKSIVTVLPAIGNPL